MAEPLDNSKADENTSRAGNQARFPFWFPVWGGTVVAGGLFGFLIACGTDGLDTAPLGFLFGLVYAGFFGALIIANVAFVTWFLWLSRFRVVMGFLAGGLTGVIATLVLASDLSPTMASALIPTAWAGLLGALGGGLAGGWSHLRAKAQKLYQVAQHNRWRFTLRESFIRVTVVSALLAAYVVIVGLIQSARQNAQKSECRSNLKLIGIHLRNYHDTYDVLPPAYIADENGSPLLSWRVLAADYEYYDLDFKTKLDFSQPWDNQANSRFLSSLITVLWQCPSAEVKKPGTTQYVAVTGPGTLWQGNEPNRLSESDKRILVIEWPDSDIYWAEPRDITANELLEWLKSKPETHHPGCLLYVDGSGEVRELRTDSAPKTMRSLLVGEPDTRPPTVPRAGRDQD